MIYSYIYIYTCTAGLFPISYDTHTQILYTGLIKAIHQSEKGSLNIIGSDVAVKSLQFYPRISILLVMVLNIVEYNITVKLPITWLVLYPWLLFIQILWLPKPSTPKQPPRSASPNHSACLQIVRRQCTERRGGKGQAWDLETAMQNIGLQRTSGSTKNHGLHGGTMNR